jgi:alkaline phosphatase D
MFLLLFHKRLIDIHRLTHATTMSPIKLFSPPLLALYLSITASAETDNIKHLTLPQNNPDITLTQFAFGACWQPNRSQGHWEKILSNHPQFWLWLGDNIYANTTNPKVMAQKYGELAHEPGYKKLVKTLPVLATWDDHDFGKNDVGGDFPMKEESQRQFLDFFNIPADSPRRKRPGVYTSYTFGNSDQRVQLILLDTRYFRSPLKKISGKPPYRRMGKWTPDTDPEKTMLGEAQWQWLESELKKPARFRIIASSIQFSAPFNGHETWANLPLERQRMIDLIKKTKAEGVVFLSGDIHSSEFCIEEPDGCYPLFDHTSSSLNVPLGANATHRRLGPAFGGANFGVISINWHPQDNPNDPTITFTTKDAISNVTRLQHTLSLSDLTFAKENVTPEFDENNFGGYWETFYGTMIIYKHPGNHWTASTPNRSAILKLKNRQLVGTWKSSGKKGAKKAGGQCTFKLTRNGHFILGSYSYGDLPQQLDWAAWRAPWAFHFNWKK